MDGNVIPRREKALTIEDRRELSLKRLKMDVSPFEMEIINQFRKLNHGKFIIQIMDGVPFRYMIEESKVFFEGEDAFDILDRVTKGGK